MHLILKPNSLRFPLDRSTYYYHYQSLRSILHKLQTTAEPHSAKALTDFPTLIPPHQITPN